MAGLYVHVPFCRQKCVYCDFCSYPNRIDAARKYFSCLKKELILYGAKEKKPFEIDTVFFGGGTPSAVDSSLITDFLEFVAKVCDLNGKAEITVECNPDSASQEKIFEFASSGVNRLSIGLQTADDGTLKLLNRPHCLAQFENAVSFAAAAGIDNVSADIILGLPYETPERLDRTLDTLIKVKLTHVSAYALTVERGTRLSAMLNQKTCGGRRLVLPDEDATADFYDAVYRRLLSAGFCRYEVSNFALKGLECRHNLNYWRCGEYIGLGVSAHSYLHGVRRSNIKNLEKYIRALDEGRLPVVGRHRLTEKEKAYECFILGLRTEEGVDAERISSEFNKAADDYLRTAFELAERGLLEKVGSRLRVPSDKFYVLNSILCEF